MKAYTREEHLKSNCKSTWENAWRDASTSAIRCYLEDFRKFLKSLEKSFDGPFTFASREMVEIIKNRPDYPELEKGMKKIYGDGWELISYEEADDKLGSGGDRDT